MAISLAREGHDRKACAALLSTGLCPAPQKQCRRFAACTLPSLCRLPALCMICLLHLNLCLMRWPRPCDPSPRTAPGPSGLRVQHLREATAAGEADALYQHLASVVRARLALLLLPPSLVPASSRCQSPRPVYAPLQLAKLCGDSPPSASWHMSGSWPGTISGQLPSGVEAAVHTTRSWVERHGQQNDHVLLKLDFRNAFNEVSRQTVLDIVQAHFPALARWATWCYQHPSSLYFGGRMVIPLAAGVEQGDLLGPLLFAAAIQPLAEQLQASMPFSVFYLDDGVLAGDALSVGRGLQAIQQVTLNLDKCELVAVGPTSSATLTAHSPHSCWRMCMATAVCFATLICWGLPLAPLTLWLGIPCSGYK